MQENQKKNAVGSNTSISVLRVCVSGNLFLFFRKKSEGTGKRNERKRLFFAMGFQMVLKSSQ